MRRPPPFLLLLILVVGWLISTKALAQPATAQTEYYELTGWISSIVVQADGKIIVCTGGSPHRGFLGVTDAQTGAFGNVLGGVFRFNPDGTLDHTFYCKLDRETGADFYKAQIALVEGGKLITQGERGELVRLLGNGAVDGTFSMEMAPTNAPGLRAMAQTGAVFYNFAVTRNGSIAAYATGDWEIFPRISFFTFNLPFPAINEYDAKGAFLKHAEVAPPDRITACLVSGGLVLTQPFMGSMGPGKPKEVIGLTPVSAQFTTDAETEAIRKLFASVPLEMVRFACRLPDGGSVLLARNTGNSARLLRFDRDWKLDTNFRCDLEQGQFNVVTMTVDRRGRIYIAGDFSSLNGKPFHGLARLESDGSTDTRFQVEVGGNKGIATLATQSDGHLLVGGLFSEINGLGCPHMARLNEDGSVDRAFLNHFDHRRFAASRTWAKVYCQARQGVSVSLPENAEDRVLLLQDTNFPSAERFNLPASLIAIQNMTLARGHVEIHFQGVINHEYTLQVQEALETTWSDYLTNRTDDRGMGVFMDDNASRSMRFYRVKSAVP